MLFHSAVLRQTNIWASSFSVNYWERALHLRVTKHWPIPLRQRFIKSRILQTLSVGDWVVQQRLDCPQGHIQIYWTKPNCVPVWLLLRYAAAYVILEIIMSWDGFMVAANVSNLNKNSQKM